MRPLTIRFRMIVEQWERFVLPLVALLGAMGLYSFARHVGDAGASRSPDGSGPGLTVRSEIRTIYAPKGIIDFARAHPAIATNDELVRLVRERGSKYGSASCSGTIKATETWLTSRWRSDRERTRWSSRTRGACCAYLAGDAAGSPAADRKNVEIEVIEDALMSMEARRGIEAVAQARTRSSPRGQLHAPPRSIRRVCGQSRLLQRAGPGITLADRRRRMKKWRMKNGEWQRTIVLCRHSRLSGST